MAFIDYVECDNCNTTGAITDNLYNKYKNKLQKIKCFNCNMPYNNIDEEYTHKVFSVSCETLNLENMEVENGTSA